jgi:hypothetical protein
MTLVEMVAAIVVISIVGAMVLPIMAGATDAYAESAAVRRASERAAYAMERSIRLLRDVPPGAIAGDLGISAAAADAVTLTDGRGLVLRGDVLMLVTPSGETPLVPGVRSFTIGYVGADGVTSVLATPRLAYRFTIALNVEGLELRSVVAPRVRMVMP